MAYQDPNKKPDSETYSPKDNETKDLTYVYGRWQAMKKNRLEYEKEWQQFDEQYEMTGPRRPLDDWKADLRLPDTTAAILAALSEMVDQTPGVSYLPREISDQSRADKLNAAFKYSWEKGQGNLELIDHLLQSAIYGTAIAKECYRYEVGEQKEITEWEKDEDGTDLPVPKSWEVQPRIIYDDVHFKSIHIRNFWVDEKATTIENAEDCVEIELLGEESFHQIYDRNYPNAKFVHSGQPIDFDWYKSTKPEDVIEVIHYWNCRKDMYAICANGVLLTIPGNPNYYKHKELPYVSSVFLPRPRCFYGIGIPKLTMGLQEEKDTVRNMRLDQSKLNINQIVVVDDKIELDEDDLRSRPNQVVKGPPGSVEYIRGPAPNPSSYQEEQLLRDDMIIAHGVDPRLQTLGGSGDTATEIAILKESSLKRIRLTLRILEWAALYRVGRLRLANFIQFYSIPKFQKIIGENGEIQTEAVYPKVGVDTGQGRQYIQFDERDLRGEYDVIVVSGSTLPVSEALESQKAINLFDRLKGHPDINQRQLVTDLIRAHMKNPSDLLTKPQEPPMGMGMGQAPGGPGVPPVPGNGMAGLPAQPQLIQRQDLPAPMPPIPMGPNMSQ